MTTLYQGGPVMGGTFPALIWASVMSAWEEIKKEEEAEKEARKSAKEHGERYEAGETESYVAPESSGEVEAAPETEEAAPAPEEEAPETEAPEAAPEAPAEEAAPEGGNGAGGGVTAG
jgi:hypothetical protein